MGWNSFDSFGVYLTEEAALENIEAMARILKPHGYEYIVVDNGWFGEYRLRPGTRFAAEKHASDVRLDAHGYFQPSKCYFPSGFAPLIRRCRELGLKFGVHLMRGIPRKAVELNLPIEGTPYRARDIADTDPARQCRWCTYNYGVDMSKPGAQAWYDGLIRHLVSQGVEFIKYDDIVPFPREVEAVAEAIRKTGRPVVLSLSPGGQVDPAAIRSFRRANMLRVTSDIWDTQHDIDLCFAAWRRWSGHERPGFWIDMDMIPFGELQVMNPPAKGGNTPAEDARTVSLAGKGTHRRSALTQAQMLTFITLRALAASPLMVGGHLPTLDAFSLRLLTEREMIACNQNGIMARLMWEKDGIEVWYAPKREDPSRGWAGVFNRTGIEKTARVEPGTLGFAAPRVVRGRDVWNERNFEMKADRPLMLTLPPQGAAFLRVE